MAVYDCFTFYNEFELLELRLSLLYDVVDKFVIVEVNKTHRGKPKPWNFSRRQHEFAKWQDKIIYIQTDVNMNWYGADDWCIENYHRNSIMDGLRDCKPDDVIMISDLDEIPKAEVIANLDNLTVQYMPNRTETDEEKLKYFYCWLRRIGGKSYSREVTNVLKNDALVLEMELFYYFLNCRSRVNWQGTVIVRYENIRVPHYWRNMRTFLGRIEMAGWHFSYLGGIQRIKNKLNSIVEGNPKWADTEHIEYCLQNGKDLYGRKGKEFEYDFISKEDIGISCMDDFIGKYPYLYRKV